MLKDENGLILETERLWLVCLTPHLLRLWVEDVPALERALACSYRAEPMSGLFLEIVKGQLAATERDPVRYPWHSFFFLLRKTDRVVVGAADFKDVPDADGNVEIGYGLGKAYTHRGYMTEAVEALCRWALAQSSVSTVLAETELSSLPSHRVLERCGFVRIRQADMLWWQRHFVP